jgi:Fic family protein
MARAAQYQKLHINYAHPELLEPVTTDLLEIREFIRYYEVDASLMKPYIYQVHREELEMISPYFNTEKAEIDYDHLLAGAKDPENDEEQITVNLSGILKSLDAGKEEFSLGYLQKLQVAIHHRLQKDHAGIGLRMETNSLFAAAEVKETEHLLDHESKEWLDEILKMANDKEIDPLVKSWLFYYYFNILKPFNAYNELLAYLVCKKILVSEKLDFFNTLNPEQYVFRDKTVIKVYTGLAEKDNFEDRLNADPESYITACIHGFMNNIKAVRTAITDTVREQLDYQSLTPRQKNSLNFWLEKAFFIHKDKLDQLTPRQHEIMLLIAKYGSLSNKELVPVFMVDRKTIQRDFNALLDLKLLDQRGGGRALKYYINLRVSLE